MTMPMNFGAKGGNGMKTPFLIVAGVILIGVGAVLVTRKAPSPPPPTHETVSTSPTTATATTGTCKEENVSLPNYSDPGKRLRNCFVQYPGEPSRQDKSYYIVEDTCGQFTQAFMEGTLGGKITHVAPPQIAGINDCSYYLTDKEYVMLNLDYLSVANQKTGNEAMGRKVEKASGIPMDNMVVYQEDGAINVIYLILGPEKFLSLRPRSKATIPNDRFLTWAANIGSAIKSYK